MHGAGSPWKARLSRGWEALSSSARTSRVGQETPVTEKLPRSDALAAAAAFWTDPENACWKEHHCPARPHPASYLHRASEQALGRSSDDIHVENPQLVQRAQRNGSMSLPPHVLTPFPDGCGLTWNLSSVQDPVSEGVQTMKVFSVPASAREEGTLKG